MSLRILQIQFNWNGMRIDFRQWQQWFGAIAAIVHAVMLLSAPTHLKYGEFD